MSMFAESSEGSETDDHVARTILTVVRGPSPPGLRHADTAQQLPKNQCRLGESGLSMYLREGSTAASCGTEARTAPASRGRARYIRARE
jgi:hypothetical protein